MIFMIYNFPADLFLFEWLSNREEIIPIDSQRTKKDSNGKVNCVADLSEIDNSTLGKTFDTSTRK